MKIIADMPDKWNGQRCGLCCECPLLYWVRKASGDKRAECPLATAQEAKEIKTLTPHHVGFKLYAVEVKK